MSAPDHDRLAMSLRYRGEREGPDPGAVLVTHLLLLLLGGSIGLVAGISLAAWFLS